MRKIFSCITALAVTICAEAFQMDDITYTPNDDGITCTLTDGKYVSGDIVVPETVSDNGVTYTVTEIAKQAFAQNNGIESISIPGTVKIIGRLAFSYSTLKKAILAEGVEDIGFSCFSSCSQLEEVILPSTITELGSYSALTGVYGQAFYNCTSLTTVNIPESITVIRSSTFRGCSSLADVTIPESVQTIEDMAFYECSSITELTIPESVTEIGASCFLSCNSLKHITLPPNLGKICEGTFLWCRALEGIVIPDGITEIETQAFTDCSSLTEVVIPNSVECIGKAAFSGCSSVEKFEIGTGTKHIGLAALGLWDVDENLNYIWKISEITVKAVTPPVYYNPSGSDFDSDFFFADPDFPDEDKEAFLAGVTLYVPEESLELYRTADQWSLFNNIKAIGDEPIDNDVSEILGEYVWTYDSEIGEGKRKNGVVEIKAVEGSNSKVSISGIYPEAGLVIEGTYNSQSKRLTLENQTFTGADGEDFKFYHAVWATYADGHVEIQPSEEPLICSFNDGAFKFNEMDIILVTTADGEMLVAADFNKWGDDVVIEDSWTLIGKAHFQDGWISPNYRINQAENIYEVEMEQNDQDPDIYRLVHPYSKSYGSAISEFNSSQGEGYIVFDISNPDHVLFISVPCGFSDARSSEYYLYNTLAYGCYMLDTDAETVIGIMGDELLSSTYEDGIVTLPNGDARLGIDGEIWGGYVWTDEKTGERLDMTAIIWFPGVNVGVGVEDVETEKTAAPEYFNLQGIRIANPAKGQIVIERLGNKATKRIFR